ncbi:hypothetical protein OC844_007884, partial [Tilletia horrida]
SGAARRLPMCAFRTRAAQAAPGVPIMVPEHNGPRPQPSRRRHIQLREGGGRLRQVPFDRRRVPTAGPHRLLPPGLRLQNHKAGDTFSAYGASETGGGHPYGTRSAQQAFVLRPLARQHRASEERRIPPPRHPLGDGQHGLSSGPLPCRGFQEHRCNQKSHGSDVDESGLPPPRRDARYGDAQGRRQELGRSRLLCSACGTASDFGCGARGGPELPRRSDCERRRGSQGGNLRDHQPFGPAGARTPASATAGPLRAGRGTDRIRTYVGRRVSGHAACRKPARQRLLERQADRSGPTVRQVPSAKSRSLHNTEAERNHGGAECADGAGAPLLFCILHSPEGGQEQRRRQAPRGGSSNPGNGPTIANDGASL